MYARTLLHTPLDFSSRGSLPNDQWSPACADVAAIVTAINPGEYVTEVTMIVARIRNVRKQSSPTNNKTRLFTLTDVYLWVATRVSQDENPRWRIQRRSLLSRNSLIVIIKLID